MLVEEKKDTNKHLVTDKLVVFWLVTISGTNYGVTMVSIFDLDLGYALDICGCLCRVAKTS